MFDDGNRTDILIKGHLLFDLPSVNLLDYYALYINSGRNITCCFIFYSNGLNFVQLYREEMKQLNVFFMSGTYKRFYKRERRSLLNSIDVYNVCRGFCSRESGDRALLKCIIYNHN